MATTMFSCDTESSPTSRGYKTSEYFDHMHFDASLNKWFGSTRGRSASNGEYDMLSFWYMQATSDGTPVLASKIKFFKRITNNIDDKYICVGMYPSTGSQDEIHAILSKPISA